MWMPERPDSLKMSSKPVRRGGIVHKALRNETEPDQSTDARFQGTPDFSRHSLRQEFLKHEFACDELTGLHGSKVRDHGSRLVGNSDQTAAEFRPRWNALMLTSTNLSLTLRRIASSQAFSGNSSCVDMAPSRMVFAVLALPSSVAISTASR